MTERGPFTGMRGAPDPAEPSNPGDPAVPAGPPEAAAPTADLAAVRRTDAIIESLASRRAAGPASRPAPGAETGRACLADDPDPAVRLLRALISDVDDPGPGCDAGPEPTPPPSPGPGSGPRRRGPRTIVALGVAGVVLASTGVAAAGSGTAGRATSAAPPPSSTAETSEEADKTVRADTDAGTHKPVRPPVRPAPGPERPAPAPKPAPTPSGDPGKPTERPRHPFPDRPRLPDIPDIPAATFSAPARRTGAEPRETGAPSDDAETRRKLDDFRKHGQKYFNRHKDPERDD